MNAIRANSNGSRRSFERITPRFASGEILFLDHVCADPPYENEPISLPFCGLGFVRSGIGDMRVGGESFLADTSQIVLFNARTDYHVRHRGCRGRACASTLHIEPSTVSETLESFDVVGGRQGDLFSRPVVPIPPELKLLHYRLLAATRNGENGFEAEELALEVLGLAVRTTRGYEPDRGIHGPGRGRETNLLVDRTKNLLAERFVERPSLAEIADHVGCSRFHLCRVFKAETGLTMTRYLHRLCIANALERLYEGEDDLSRLALDLGYSSHSHFTTVFRRHLGKTPSEARALLSTPESMIQ